MAIVKLNLRSAENKARDKVLSKAYKVGWLDFEAKLGCCVTGYVITSGEMDLFGPEIEASRSSGYVDAKRYHDGKVPLAEAGHSFSTGILVAVSGGNKEEWPK